MKTRDGSWFSLYSGGLESDWYVQDEHVKMCGTENYQCGLESFQEEAIYHNNNNNNNNHNHNNNKCIYDADPLPHPFY